MRLLFKGGFYLRKYGNVLFYLNYDPDTISFVRQSYFFIIMIKNIVVNILHIYKTNDFVMTSIRVKVVFLPQVHLSVENVEANVI